MKAQPVRRGDLELRPSAARVDGQDVAGPQYGKSLPQSAGPHVRYVFAREEEARQLQRADRIEQPVRGKDPGRNRAAGHVSLARVKARRDLDPAVVPELPEDVQTPLDTRADRR